MNIIESTTNALIKQIVLLHKKKHRNEQGLFLIEGQNGVQEAIKANIEIEKIFLTEELSSAFDIAQDKQYICNEAVLKKISTTDTFCPVIAVAKQKASDIKEIKNTENPFIILLEDIKDAGNLGTIIRTSIAFGATGIVLTGEPIDIYNPKVVRASVGNLWKMPIIKLQNKELKETFKEYEFFATVVQNASSSADADFSKPSVLMFGSEAKGLSKELVKLADKKITIPMQKNVESLNLSISVGALCYQAFGQRN